MNSNRIANRISDLLKLTGFSEQNTIEELTDHYLTHIEEEVKRGLNSQQAIRETFQEIANIDITEFKGKKKKENWKWIILLAIIMLGSTYFAFSPQEKIEIPVAPKENSALEVPSQPKEITPPSGLPTRQPNLDITSGFGFRIHPMMKQRKMHSGIDIRAKSGTPVLATGDGLVIEAGYKEKPGNYVVIQHDGGYTTKFYHLSDLTVVSGVEVTEGQQIGEVGNSGMSFKSHLHYEVLKDDVPMNPKEIIKP